MVSFNRMVGNAAVNVMAVDANTHMSKEKTCVYGQIASKKRSLKKIWISWQKTKDNTQCQVIAGAPIRVMDFATTLAQLKYEQKNLFQIVRLSH